MDGEVLGEGGLLLTSFKVDNVSRGDTASVDGGAKSHWVGLGWTLNQQKKKVQSSAEGLELQVERRPTCSPRRSFLLHHCCVS